MPVVRVCAHCKKSMIASTYQLMDHVFNKCPVYKENVIGYLKDNFRSGKCLRLGYINNNSFV